MNISKEALFIALNIIQRRKRPFSEAAASYDPRIWDDL